MGSTLHPHDAAQHPPSEGATSGDFNTDLIDIDIADPGGSPLLYSDATVRMLNATAPPVARAHDGDDRFIPPRPSAAIGRRRGEEDAPPPQTSFADLASEFFRDGEEWDVEPFDLDAVADAGTADIDLGSGDLRDAFAQRLAAAIAVPPDHTVGSDPLQPSTMHVTTTSSGARLRRAESFARVFRRYSLDMVGPATLGSRRTSAASMGSRSNSVAPSEGADDRGADFALLLHEARLGGVVRGEEYSRALFESLVTCESEELQHRETLTQHAMQQRAALLSEIEMSPLHQAGKIVACETRERRALSALEPIVKLTCILEPWRREVLVGAAGKGANILIGQAALLQQEHAARNAITNEEASELRRLFVSAAELQKLHLWFISAGDSVFAIEAAARYTILEPMYKHTIDVLYQGIEQYAAYCRVWWQTRREEAAAWHRLRSEKLWCEETLERGCLEREYYSTDMSDATRNLTNSAMLALVVPREARGRHKIINRFLRSANSISVLFENIKIILQQYEDRRREVAAAEQAARDALAEQLRHSLVQHHSYHDARSPSRPRGIITAEPLRRTSDVASGPRFASPRRAPSTLRSRWEKVLRELDAVDAQFTKETATCQDLSAAAAHHRDARSRNRAARTARRTLEEDQRKKKAASSDDDGFIFQPQPPPSRPSSRRPSTTALDYFYNEGLRTTPLRLRATSLASRSSTEHPPPRPPREGLRHATGRRVSRL